MNFKKYIKDLFNNYGYSLNYIQKQAGKENNKGRSMIISAETGSGKTEAALIAVRNGVTGIDIMLPYISACNFMYNRLKKQFPQIEWNIATSIFKDTEGEPIAGRVNIFCPDGPLIRYIEAKFRGEKLKVFQDTIILDEFHEYPPEVKRALMEYVKDFPETQFIILSATLTQEESGYFRNNGATEIKNKSIQTEKVTHIYEKLNSVESVVSIVRKNLGKKVVFIMNSIKAIKKISLTLEKFKIPHDVLHSELDMYDRRKVEAKIADNDFGILVSNQMISHSLDIDASVMFIECPDSLAHLVQILGRCNRLKKEIFGTNLYVFNIDEGELFQEFRVRHVDENDQRKVFEDIFAKNSAKITNTQLSEISADLEAEEVPSLVSIKVRWAEIPEDEHSLREIPYKIRAYFYKEVDSEKIGFTETVHTYREIKNHADGRVIWDFIGWSSPLLMDEDPQNILKFKDEIYIIHEKRGKTLIGEAYRSEIFNKKI